MRQRRARTGPESWAWVPEGISEDKCRKAASRARQETVPSEVLMGEDMVKKAIGEGLAWEKRIRALMHTGDVQLPEETDGWYVCDRCGAETMDDVIFAELGESCV